MLSRFHRIPELNGQTDRGTDRIAISMAGSIVNLCAVDLSKAFDKVNQHATFIKLTKRHVPVHL